MKSFLLMILIVLFFSHESAPDWTFKELVFSTNEMLIEMERRQ